MMKLSTDEIARGLGIPIQTLERWVRQGRIPLQRSGTHCEFRLSALEKWAEKHQLRLQLHDPSDERQEDSEETKLREAMQRGDILYEVEGSHQQEVLYNTIRDASAVPESQKEALLEMLMQRELLASTGVGKGVAFPHPRSPMEGISRKGTIITAFPKTPIDYGSIDGLPVFAIFVLLSPKVQTHLHMLSRLSYCTRNDAFIDFLRTVPAPGPLIAKIADFEGELESGETS